MPNNDRLPAERWPTDTRRPPFTETIHLKWNPHSVHVNIYTHTLHNTIGKERCLPPGKWILGLTASKNRLWTCDQTFIEWDLYPWFRSASRFKKPKVTYMCLLTWLCLVDSSLLEYIHQPSLLIMVSSPFPVSPSPPLFFPPLLSSPRLPWMLNRGPCLPGARKHASRTIGWARWCYSVSIGWGEGGMGGKRRRGWWLP